MTRRRNCQPRKEPETMPSVTDLMDMDLRKMSKKDFRVTFIKLLFRLEKTISNSIESLRAECRATVAYIKNAMKEMPSKLDTLNARVNKKEEQISDLEDKLMGRKEVKNDRDKQLQAHKIRSREINDTMKLSKVTIIGIPKGME